MAVELLTQLPSYITGLADDVISDGYSSSRAYANQWMGYLQPLMDRLSNFSVSEISINVDLPSGGSLSTFQAPPRPTDAIDDFELPPDPRVEQLDSVSLNNSAGPAPDDDIEVEDYNVPGTQPGALVATRPGNAPTFDPIEIPAGPTDDELYVAPPDTLPIPSMPPELTLDAVEFEGDRPDIEFGVPEMSFAFEETPYTSDLADAIAAAITVVVNGGTGLTAAQEQMSFDQAAQREDNISLAARQEAFEDFASRGFSSPNGILARRLRIERQKRQDALLEHSRKVELDNKQLMIDSFHKACANGIALEQNLITAHLALEERRFLAAKFGFESILAIFNANVSLYNASVQAYQTDAQVFRDRIQAMLGEVEVYKAQIDAVRAAGEVNKVLAEVYDTKVRATLALIERYKVRMDAARLQSEINQNELEAFRTEVQAYGLFVDAWGKEWEAYKIQVDAERGKLEAGQIASDIYRTRVQAWSTKKQADIEQLKADIAVEELKARGNESAVQTFVALVQAETARIGSQVSRVQANATLYEADGRMAIAASDAENRAYALAFERSRADTTLRLDNLKARVAQFQAAREMELKALDGVVRATTQVVGSSLSSVNVGGQVSVNASGGMGYNEALSYTYSGDAPVIAP